MKTGIELIAEEREEQKVKHGYSLDEDAEYYSSEELRKAAIYSLTLDRGWYPESWEFWWHDKMMSKKERMSQNEFYIERLKIAGALIAAEIDRLQSQ